jgi:hypothetical protein
VVAAKEDTLSLGHPVASPNIVWKGSEFKVAIPKEGQGITVRPPDRVAPFTSFKSAAVEPFRKPPIDWGDDFGAPPFACSHSRAIAAPTPDRSDRAQIA